LFVTIRPPQVIPGAAEIEVRSQTAAIRQIKASPLPLSGAGARTAPVADILHRTAADAQFFTGTLWLMTDGSWQIRLTVDGAEGAGTLAIPVPAIARITRGMQWQLGMVLAIMGLFLVGGLTAISGAAVRDAKLDAGSVASEKSTRKGRVAMLISFVIIGLVLIFGKIWWDREADVFRGRIYKPLNMRASLTHSSILNLNLSEPGWMQPQPGKLTRILFERKMDDLVLDHNHLMHLYVIREPGLDVIYHLHPDLIEADDFRLTLPAMPPGTYRLYADVVHENGLPETLTSSLTLPAGISNQAGRALSGDDASAEPGTAALGDTYTLPDGYRMQWLHDATPLHARQGCEFRFMLTAPNGSKPSDMALYMGMLGHAAFVKADGTVFAHVHPNGTVAMSAFMLAQGTSMDHSSMQMDNTGIPNVVAFPYGLPTPGRYRIFVQMKHGDTIETGSFDAIAAAE